MSIAPVVILPAKPDLSFEVRQAINHPAENSALKGLDDKHRSPFGGAVLNPDIDVRAFLKGL
ncbi:MAG: hypothetical protein ACC633_08425 [Anaerolineales bacterium]